MAVKVRTEHRNGRVQVIRYLRVSRMGDRTLSDPRFHSAELQIAAIDQRFDEVFGTGGWELADVEGNHSRATWADFNVTGTTMTRAGLDAAVDAVEGIGARAIGVLNLSRWGRTVAPALRRIDELQARGVNLLSASEDVNVHTAEGKFALTMFLAMAEMEASRKGQGWANVIERRARAGLHHGRPPAGYTSSPGSGTISHDLVISLHILHAFEQYAAGASKREVGRGLVEAGLISTPGQARNVLANRAYIRLHSSTCTGASCEQSTSHGDHGEVRSYDLDETTKQRVGERWFPAVHHGLIPADLFNKVQQRLAETDAEQSGRSREVQTVAHPLQGIVRCGHCGRSLALDRGRTSGRIPTYKDSSGKDAGCAGPGAVAADRLLAAVMPYIHALIDKIDLHATSREIADRDRVRASSQRPRDERTHIKARREKRLDLLADLTNQLELGEGDTTVLTKRIEHLQAEIDELGQKLAAAIAEPDLHHIDVKKLVATAERQLERWDELEPAHQREVIRSVIESVYVWPRDKNAPFRQPYEERIYIEAHTAFRPHAPESEHPHPPTR